MSDSMRVNARNEIHFDGQQKTGKPYLADFGVARVVKDTITQAN